MKAVLTEHLSKTYSSGKKAVDDIGIALEPGEVFGFLGPNGAGKTTTVKLLCGMLAPTRGSCRVFDIDSSQNPEKLHQVSGVVTEHAQMYDYMTGLENLIFYGTLFGMDAAESQKRGAELLERLDLLDAGNRKLAAYSTGMRQRLSLARAMIHHPKILFLDEPTSGLDPESAQNVNRLIRELADEGATIFLCTHQLRYAQEICTTYGLIDEGALLAAGTIEELRELIFSGVRVIVKADRFPKGLNSRAVGNGVYEITVDSEGEIPLLVKQIVDSGGDVYHVSAEKMSLEEIYFSLIDRRKVGKEDERHE
ncbi:ABC transporter ATP-binding protein [Lachnospiraceae bacterium]|uniref:ABC transporter ATP-binding protein n=1 Tax=Extibacter sp. GGCC_0201 TaxID=2731209 RepID=UPI001AA1215C|nr:ABC transporter ATP-binding protein [Extibacter sp. GGCC_0201]MBO1721530.1 ABC transporter ATP-binding protein [Extibacter sp. GGCC_0201]BDF35207.1 ABC transporter ATP-binding protein [Lachnospiraceae bacterium]BDF39208.1 ABC transporter ATP-binding protein [Lachnospiraceae bacterium]